MNSKYCFHNSCHLYFFFPACSKKEQELELIRVRILHGSVITAVAFTCDIHDPLKNNKHVQHTFADSVFMQHMLLLFHSHHPLCIHICHQSPLICSAHYYTQNTEQNLFVWKRRNHRSSKN